MAVDGMQITSVRIQNYRSILNEDFRTNRLNLFVGLNDVGKSNILRALDLFFNGTAAASPFVFDRDFSKHARTPSNKAKEVRVTLTMRLPPSYDASEILWRKVWRSGGHHEPGNELRHLDGSQLKPRSKVPAFLNSVRFEYVPAVKGSDYFQTLLRGLHDVLVGTVAADIRAASGGFTSTINEKTQAALAEIEAKLGIKSTIQLPADLRELFSRLEFQSDGPLGVPLGLRGDGVKARHIPILLHYLAQQSRTRRVKGSPQVQTIWGFEEPENNLEMLKAAELASECVAYSKEIQIFATTHSPAFYSLARSSPTVTPFLVSGSGEDGATQVKTLASNEMHELDEHVGLMPVVAPMIAEAVESRERALAILQRTNHIASPALFVEGTSDARVFTRALELLAPTVLERATVRSEDQAGAPWVKDMLISWAHSRTSHLALGLFDDDDAGREAKSAVVNNDRVKSSNQAFLRENGRHRIKALLLGAYKPHALVAIARKGLLLPIALEELFPIEVWRYAEQKGWLIERSEAVALNKFTALDDTFENYCRSKNASKDELLLLTRQLKPFAKGKLARYVCGLSGQALNDAFVGFAPLVKEVEKFFAAEPPAAVPAVADEGVGQVATMIGPIQTSTAE